jgi:hypothetical protein
MALGSIKKAYDVYRTHDFSRSFQLRILDVGDGVPSYVRKELIDQEGRVYINTASVPGRTITDVKIPYQGFNFHAPGQVEYANNPWKLDIKTPGDYLLRNALERWSFETASDETSCGSYNMPCKNSNIAIAILSPKCEILKIYRLYGVYIQNISEIAYNQENVEVTKFTADFHYQYWRPEGGNDTGLIESGGSLSNEVDGVYQTLANATDQGLASCPTIKV